MVLQVSLLSYVTNSEQSITLFLWKFVIVRLPCLGTRVVKDFSWLLPNSVCVMLKFALLKYCWWSCVAIVRLALFFVEGVGAYSKLLCGFITIPLSSAAYLEAWLDPTGIYSSYFYAYIWVKRGVIVQTAWHSSICCLHFLCQVFVGQQVALRFSLSPSHILY